MQARLAWCIAHAPTAEMGAFARAYQVALKLGPAFGVEDRREVLILVQQSDFPAAEAVIARVLERAAGVRA